MESPVGESAAVEAASAAVESSPGEESFAAESSAAGGPSAGQPSAEELGHVEQEPGDAEEELGGEESPGVEPGALGRAAEPLDPGEEERIRKRQRKSSRSQEAKRKTS